MTTTHSGERLGLSAFRAAQLFDSGELRGVRDSSGRRLIYEDSVEELVRRRAAARQKVMPSTEGR